jgi:hypothetical protein
MPKNITLDYVLYIKFVWNAKNTTLDYAMYIKFSNFEDVLYSSYSIRRIHNKESNNFF